MMEAIRSSEMSVFTRATRRHISEDALLLNSSLFITVKTSFLAKVFLTVIDFNCDIQFFNSKPAAFVAHVKERGKASERYNHLWFD
jgi:hypothetical protein